MSIDVKNLRQTAKTSTKGEAVVNFSKFDSLRIDVGVRQYEDSETFIEVSFPLCKNGKPDTFLLETAVPNLRLLQDLGYSLECSDSVVVGEKIVSEETLLTELNTLIERVC